MWKSNKRYHLLWQRGFFLMDHLRETLAEEAGDGFLQMYGDLTYGQSKEGATERPGTRAREVASTRIGTNA